MARIVRGIFSFEHFLTPVLIRALYLVSVVMGFVVMIIAVAAAIAGGNSEEGREVLGVLGYSAGGEHAAAVIVTAVVSYAFGILILRIVLEAVMVVFSIDRHLADAASRLGSMQSDGERSR